MEKQKKFSGRPKRPASIDGIVTGGRQLGVPVGGRRELRKHAGSDISFEAVAHKDDGFFPSRVSRQPVGINDLPEQEEEVLLDEPIVLDEDKTKKKSRYFNFSPFKKRKNLKRISLALLSIFLIVGVYLGGKTFYTERQLFRGGGKAPALSSKVDINQLKGEGDGRINILLLGIGGPGHDGPDLTDTIMIASIDPVNNKVALLSIPRDLWVKIPKNGYQKINAAYPDGKMQSKAKTEAGKDQDGLKLLDQTIEPVIGINIHYHAVVDFPAFKDMVDALGGVTVNVKDQLYDPSVAWENNWNPVIAKTGIQVMHGKQALLYARSRETSSDFARGQRQRQLLVAIKEKALSLGTFSNPIKISNLLSSLGNNVYTDFSLNDMTRLYQIINNVQSTSVDSVDLVTPPHNLLTTANVNGLSVVEPRAGIFEYSAMTNFIRSTLRDGFLAKENAGVAIYNATNTAGLATSQSDLLKSYGYSVTTVDNTATATNPAKTTLVDLTNGKDKYTRHYLENRYNTNAVSKVPASFGITPPVGTNFVIILGEDVTTTH